MNLDSAPHDAGYNARWVILGIAWMAVALAFIDHLAWISVAAALLLALLSRFDDRIKQ